MKSRFLAIAIGVWYIVAPFAWGYSADWKLNWWLDIIIGAAVLVLAGSFLIGWSRIAGWLLIAVGAFSMFSPFIFGYLMWSDPYWNDLVFGILTVASGVALSGAAIEYGGRSHRPA